MAKNKKINQLKIKECEKILKSLANHSGSQYYAEVFKHYHRLLLSKEHIYNKNNDSQIDQKTTKEIGTEGPTARSVWIVGGSTQS